MAVSAVNMLTINLSFNLISDMTLSRLPFLNSSLLVMPAKPMDGWNVMQLTGAGLYLPVSPVQLNSKNSQEEG